MCGLTGFVTAKDAPDEWLRTSVQKMSATLRHRGPDDDGTYVEPSSGLALGFRRLAILDLSPAGSQPMHSPSGRYVTVFNGEVYNFRELRSRLSKAGIEFHSECDTEVVLAAIDRWGLRESLQRFVGMFAMAVWDREEKKLILARDRLGIKPLFVYEGGRSVAFASELKALCRAPGFRRQLDHNALALYLRYLYVPAPETIYQSTVKVPPGHTLTVSTPPKSDLPDPEPYWSLDEVVRRGRGNRFQGSPHEAAERLGELLDESVRQRLVADVPVGALLSGGIDSSAIVAAMQKISAQPVKTFTVSFDRAKHDESDAARAVAEHLGTEHTELEVGGRDAQELVPRLPEMFDEPHANPAQVPTYLVCELAKHHVTVGLAGDGGDEIFGGYNRYRYGALILPRAAHVPRPLRRGGAAVIGAISTENWESVYRKVGALLPSSIRHRLPGSKIRKIGDILTFDDVPAMYRSLLSACGKPDNLLLKGTEPSGLGSALPSERLVPNLLERMMLADQRHYLPDDLLAKIDRASMATSLEVRVPLLDHRIVEFSWRLPPEMKIRDGVTKWVLKKHLGERVPRHLWDRPKVGFTVPLNSWLKGPLRDWAEDLIDTGRLRQEGVFQPQSVQSMWQSFREGETHLARGLWAILIFQAWQEKWNVSTN